MDTSVISNTNFTILPRRKGPHVVDIPLESISRLAPFSCLILSIICVIYFLVRFYILEGFLLKMVYGKIYTDMNDKTRRGFVNHHIAGTIKILILIIAAYPFIDVAFVNATFHSPFAGSKIVTQGDVLIVVAQMLIAMYIFELFYRTTISPVSVGHHIGTILIGESAIAISLSLAAEKDATIEFVLCTVWGAFDIISESFPHISIILYRIYPESHRFLKSLFQTAMITTLTGTTAETILVMYLFGSLWNRWTLAFKITTPMLHILFMLCQLWGSYNFYRMYKRQEHLISMNENNKDDVEQQRGQVKLTGVKDASNHLLAVNQDSLYTISREPSREGCRELLGQTSRDNSQTRLAVCS